VGVPVGGLDRFVSHFLNRLDAKGRVSIPASFRSVLMRDGFDGLYVHPSLDAAALDCGGNALLKEIDTLLEMHPPYSLESDIFSTALIGTSEILKIDPEGRISLSETAKAHAGISSEIAFVGLGHKFQIWEPSRFRSHLVEAKERLRTMRRDLGTRSAAGHAVDAQAPRGARE
jgi:transcriptional regulator MraZ